MLNSGIILAGQQLDVGGAMAQGQAVGENALRLRRESELHNFLAGNGGAVLSGDQGAINALSGHGVAGFNAANQIQQQGVTNARADAQLDLSGRRMDLSEQQFAFQQEQAQRQAEQQIQAELAAMSAEERAQELDNARRSFVMWSQVPEDQRDAWAQANGLTDWVGQDPESVRVGLMTAEQVAAQMEGGQETEWRDFTPEEVERYGVDGQINNSTGQRRNMPPPSGFSVETTPDGGVSVQQGPGVNEPEESRPVDPGSSDFMLDTIDGILEDPAFDSSTGWLAWKQAIPGTASRRFGTRVEQLQGQAFLQAFQALKGAGQITEVEGRKATQAIARLDSAQSPEDFRGALMELREVIVASQARAQGVGGQPAQSNSGIQFPEPAAIAAMTPAQREQIIQSIPAGSLGDVPDEVLQALLGE